MSGVSFVSKELRKILPLYDLVCDCVDGEIQVKSKRQHYLPKPNPEDDSEANDFRYDDYVKRAVFYNVCARTLKGLVGYIFAEEPLIELPANLEIVAENTNGGGLTLVQSAKAAVEFVLSLGRVGVFVDYPSINGPVTRAQVDSGTIRPVIKNYSPKDCINWRTKTRGADVVLSMVVLKEEFVVEDNGFETKKEKRFRALLLSPSKENDSEGIVDSDQADIYTVEVWSQVGGKWGITESYQPRNSAGQYFDKIPFMFCGADNNDVDIDQPPLYDMAVLNIAHYRNSADYEEGVHITGQPTLWLSGLTEEWVTDIMKGTVALGSRAAVMLPENGTAGLLQAEPNAVAFEAMQHKERQFVALGAKLIEQASVQRTATETVIESTSEHSTLSSTSKNVSNVYTWALKIAAEFTGAADSEIVFELNGDFDLASMTSQDRQQLVSEWQSGAIVFEEMREGLRKGGVATLENDDAKAKLKEESEEKFAEEVDHTKRLAEANPQPKFAGSV